MELYTLEHLLDLFEGYNTTRPINNLADGCVSFIRDQKVNYQFPKGLVDCWIICPKEFGLSSSSGSFKFFKVDYPEYHFTIFHNHKNRFRRRNVGAYIGRNTYVHDSAILGVEGVKVILHPETREIIPFKNIGELVIGNNVNIGALSIIHRGTMGDTVIGDNVQIGASCNIAHNSIIEKDTVFAVGVLTSGSVKIGKRCWLGTGSIIRNGVSICSDVVIGTGSVVVKDIVKPGIYIGNPARFLRDKPEDFNF